MTFPSGSIRNHLSSLAKGDTQQFTWQATRRIVKKKEDLETLIYLMVLLLLFESSVNRVTKYRQYHPLADKK